MSALSRQYLKVIIWSGLLILIVNISTSASCNWVLSRSGLSPQQRKRIRAEWSEYQWEPGTGIQTVASSISQPGQNISPALSEVLTTFHGLFVYQVVSRRSANQSISCWESLSVFPIIFTCYTATCVWWERLIITPV